MIKEFSLNNLIYVIPFLWGVWEFRQFKNHLIEISNKLDDITKNKLENYPLIKDTKEFMDNLNKIFNINNIKKD